MFIISSKQINFYRGYKELSSMSKEELFSQLVNYYDSYIDSIKPEEVIEYNDSTKVEYIKTYYENK